MCPSQGSTVSLVMNGTVCAVMEPNLRLYDLIVDYFSCSVYFCWDEAGIITSVASTCESFIKDKCFLDASLCSLYLSLTCQVNDCNYTCAVCLFIFHLFK